MRPRYHTKPQTRLLAGFPFTLAGRPVHQVLFNRSDTEAKRSFIVEMNDGYWLWIPVSSASTATEIDKMTQEAFTALKSPDPVPVETVEAHRPC